MNIITNDNERIIMAIEAMKNVIDPEIGLNVVDLGLIYQIDFDVMKNKIFCRMTLTTQYCPMGASITEGVTKALRQAFAGYEIELDLIFNPSWNIQMISEKGRQFLNS